MRFHTILSAVTLFVSGCANSGSANSDFPDLPPPPELTVDEAAFYASYTQDITGTVESVNHDSRLLTVRDADDHVVTMTAAEDVSNLHEVVVGNLLTARYDEYVTLRLFGDTANDVAKPSSAEDSSKTGIATIEAISLSTYSLMLKDEVGLTKAYVVRDPINLERTSVGDRVIVTTANIVATEIQHTETTNEANTD
ncbi:MAG: hypothetical protein AAF351_05810 [Pseudomonadota bacterium]